MSREEPEAQRFLAAVAADLAWPPEIRLQGASHVLAGQHRAHDVEIWCGAASGFWFETTIHCPVVTDHHVITHAPTGGYDRVKYTEEGYQPPTTGDLVFDRVFLIIGPASSEPSLAPCPPAGMRKVLLGHEGLRPTLRSGPVVRVTASGPTVTHLASGQVQLTARPSLRESDTGHLPVPLGTQGFIAQACVDMAHRFFALAEALESLPA